MKKEEFEITTAVIADTSWRELILYLFATLISYIILAHIIAPSPMGGFFLTPGSLKYHVAQHLTHLFMFLFIYTPIALARTLDKRFFRKNPSTTYKQIFKTSLIPTTIILGLLLFGAWYGTRASVN